MLQRLLARCCLPARPRPITHSVPALPKEPIPTGPMRPYRYAPLKSELQEVRLVHLLPGEFSDDIVIHIMHSPFLPPDAPPPKDTTTSIEALHQLVARPWEIEETDNGDFILFNIVTGESKLLQAAAPAQAATSQYEPKYEALSYTWGDDDIAEQAHVKETGDDGELFVTSLGMRPNLASALRHLRHTRNTRVLWIDAICINQDDIDERNEQVKRMTNIYSLAQTVVVWLGEATADSKLALAKLHQVGQQLGATKSGRIIAAPGAAQPRMWRNDYAPSFDPATWAALASFVERPWFYRIWCWQEICLGGRSAVLQCGSDTILWNEFGLAVLCLHNKDSTLSMQFRERCRHIVFLKHDARSTSVSNILDISRSKGCANPRDKVYGLLGITPDSFNTQIEVDYLRSVETVYKEAFLAHLHTTQRLELLKHCDLGRRVIGGPSWVPDWSLTEFAAPILSEQMSAGISRAWYAQKDSSDTLEVVGKQFTKILTVSEVASKAVTDTLLVVQEWYKHLCETLGQGTYVTGESLETAFVLSLCMNRTREKHPGVHFMSTYEWVAMLKTMLKLTATSWADGDSLYAARETANTIQKVRGRRFFTTESGHIGTAPADAQPGDTICIILGTFAPMVLRETADSQFQVVGECYVHGLGDLVGLLGPLPDGWKAIIRGDSYGRPMQLFSNRSSYEETPEDPRLTLLEDKVPPLKWERVQYERLPGDPIIFERFRNTETDELVNHDPRLAPEILAACGVELQSLKLV